MDDAVRTRLAAIANRRRLSIPNITLSTEGWPPEMLGAAQFVWARRVFNETGSIQIATRLRESATAAGVTDAEIIAALARLEEDEQSHAELASRVLSQLGGVSPARPPPTSMQGTPEEEFARLVLVGLAVCETVSAARYAAVRTHTDRAEFRECIELFLRDEIIHSELGFLLLPAALERLSDAPTFVRRELIAIFRELDGALGMDSERRGGLPPERPQPSGNPGVVEPAVDARAFYEAIRETILPRLERFGINASAAWNERWSTLAGRDE